MLDQFTCSVFIDASPQKVWQVLTTPALMKTWMGGEEMDIDIQTTWEVGTPILISGFHHLRFENKGQVLAFAPPTLLSYSHLSSLSRLSDEPSNFTLLHFSLAETEGHTFLTFTADHFPTETIRHHLAFYWRTTIILIKKTTEEISM